jgi:hypothetical protein
VLVAGGYNSGGYPTSAELYDRALGFDSAWRPALDAVNSPLPQGGQLVASGSGWRGHNSTEASSGATNSSATNYPLVQLRRRDNAQVLWLLPDPEQPFSASGFTSQPLQGFPQGPALVTVFVNGIPSVSEITVVKLNDPPVVEAGPDQSVDEGEPVASAGSYTDLDEPTTLGPSAVSIRWDFGDGDFASGTLTPTHAYGDNGVFTATLTITDSLGAAGSDSLTVSVANVAPSLPALHDCIVGVGETVTFTTPFTDPGLLDTHAVAITWEAGQTQVLALDAGVLEFTASHSYGLVGVYPVTVSVTDDDGGASSQGFTVTGGGPYRLYLPLLLR